MGNSLVEILLAVFLAFFLFWVTHLALERLSASQEVTSFEEAECRRVCDYRNQSICGFFTPLMYSEYSYCLCSIGPCNDESLLLTIHKNMVLLGDE